MSGEPRSAEWHAKRRWKWAVNAMKAAHRDTMARDYPNAVSRGYYAMMHAANAALALKQLHSKKHSGVQALVNLHLVLPEELERQRGRDLGQGQDERTSAEYDVTKDVRASQAHEDTVVPQVPRRARARPVVDWRVRPTENPEKTPPSRAESRPCCSYSSPPNATEAGVEPRSV